MRPAPVRPATTAATTTAQPQRYLTNDEAADYLRLSPRTLEKQRVSGVYRRSVMLASGRYAMLDDGKGFALVPWKPMLEQRMGQGMTAVVRGGNVSWSFGRQRGMSVG